MIFRATLACGAILLGGCVTETSSSTGGRGMPVKPSSSRTQSGPGQRSTPQQPAKSLDQIVADGPVAEPTSDGRSFTARVAVTIRPLGVVGSDGALLPIVSPDGGFLAVQEGQRASWPTILAQRDADVPAGGGVAIYQIKEDGLQRIEIAQPTEGLVLARSADDRGVLIESPRADGSRWVGRLAWGGSGVQWLVRDGAVNAFPVTTARDELVFCRRSVSGLTFDLILRDAAGGESILTPSSGSYYFPMYAGGDVVYALQVSDAGIEIHGVRIQRTGERAKFGAVIARRELDRSGDIALAYQIVAFRQEEPPARESASVDAPPGSLAIFFPEFNRCAVFDLATARLLALPQTSQAATPLDRGKDKGFLCTLPRGVVYTPTPVAGRAVTPPEARVVAGPYITRRTLAADGSFIMLGPVRNQPDRIEVVRLLLGEH